MYLQVAAFVALISGAAVSAERVRYGARAIAPGETTDGSVRWVSNKYFQHRNYNASSCCTTPRCALNH